MLPSIRQRRRVARWCDTRWIFIDNAVQNAAGSKKVAGFKLHPSFYLFFDKISVAP
jgi:hypothetical protein